MRGCKTSVRTRTRPRESSTNVGASDVFQNERPLPDDEPGNVPSAIIGTDGFVIFVSTCRSESRIRALGRSSAVDTYVSRVILGTDNNDGQHTCFPWSEVFVSATWQYLTLFVVIIFPFYWLHL